MFRFRLQRVLELREEREKAMAAELAAARTAADAARDQQASLEAVRDSSRGELHAANTAAPRIGHLQQLGLVLDSIDQRVQTATEQTQAAERAADTAQEALVVAARDRRILDRLKDHHADAFRSDAAQKDRVQMDEIALARFGRRASSTPRTNMTSS